jgi:DNA-binding MarR family transcriptional regulator
MERIQRPTATRIIGALVDADLVSREADTADRRIARVTLTPTGAATLASNRARRTAYLARRLERLDADQLRTLERAAELLELLTEDDPEPRA